LVNEEERCIRRIRHPASPNSNEEARAYLVNEVGIRRDYPPTAHTPFPPSLPPTPAPLKLSPFFKIFGKF